MLPIMLIYIQSQAKFVSADLMLKFTFRNLLRLKVLSKATQANRFTRVACLRSVHRMRNTRRAPGKSEGTITTKRSHYKRRKFCQYTLS